MMHAAEISPTHLIREALSSRSDQALSALESRTAHSWMMALDRAKVLPDTTPTPPPATGVRLFVKSGAGGRIIDVDGTSFIDLCLGDGTQILGHAHPVVQEAIVAQSARGWHFDLPADGQLELARLIQAAGSANERVVLCGSGDEALNFAARAARTATGKSAIAVFTGYRHLKRDGDEAVTVLPYGHPAAFDQIGRRKNELAAVIVEPVRASDPSLDRGAWLLGLADACRAAGVLFILDERETGFRLAYGGAQEVFGLAPDIVIYGNAVGGGLPLGAVAGRAALMAAGWTVRPREGVMGYGAATANPLSVTAGAATLAYLLAGRVTLYPALNAAGTALTKRFNAFAQSERLPVEMHCAGSIFRLCFGGTTPSSEWVASFDAVELALNLLLLNRGVLMMPFRQAYLAAAHSTADVDDVLAALTESLRDIRDDGLFAHVG